MSPQSPRTAPVISNPEAPTAAELGAAFGVIARALAALLAQKNMESPANVTLPALVAVGLLTKAQLAQALGVSPATLDRHDADGAPFQRVGSRKRYALEERRSWLRARGKFATPRIPRALPAVVDRDVDVDDVLEHAGLRLRH